MKQIIDEKNLFNSWLNTDIYKSNINMHAKEKWTIQKYKQHALW